VFDDDGWIGEDVEVPHRIPLHGDHVGKLSYGDVVRAVFSALRGARARATTRLREANSRGVPPERIPMNCWPRFAVQVIGLAFVLSLWPTSFQALLPRPQAA
jgi:hypothetical protein